MENLLNKSEMARLLAVAITAFACVCMWGCSDRVEFKWVGRGNMSIAGFIDDSLVVAYDCRGWLETTETWNGGYSEDESCGHDRLLVYNYRVQEEGPRWSDSLTNERGGYRWFQLTDSIFWRWEGKNILLWKIDETAHEAKISRKNEGCLHTFEIDRMHQWLDNSFIAFGGRLTAEGDSCQYAVLDTIAGTLTFKRLSDDLEWIKACDDVRAWGDDVYCVILDDEGENSLVLKNEGVMIPTPRKFAIGGFWGNTIKLSGNICSIHDDEITCSDVIWYGNGDGLKFYQNEELVVEY